MLRPMTQSGPLSDLSLVEMTGIGPVPYACMILADLGARVIRIDRPGGYPAIDPDLDFAAMGPAGFVHRSRPAIRVDLKSPAGRALVHRLAARADGIVEGYRPGTMERLGLGPEALLAANPALAVVRVTGWGQTGPMAGMAGHDLNYIGLSGALSLFGRAGTPPQAIPPLIGDMAGGALFAVIGTLAAILSARATGQGQVVDAAMLDGSANLYTLLASLAAAGRHDPDGGQSPLDGGRHFYRTYACSDGRHVAVGAIEPAFRRVLLDRLGLAGDPRFATAAPEDEPGRQAALAAIFATAPRDHWAALFAGTDGCVTPVLAPHEAARHPHAGRAFTRIDGLDQPAPAPRFAATPAAISRSPAAAQAKDPGALAEWGLSPDEIASLTAAGTLS